MFIQFRAKKETAYDFIETINMSHVDGYKAITDAESPNRGRTLLWANAGDFQLTVTAPVEKINAALASKATFVDLSKVKT